VLYDGVAAILDSTVASNKTIRLAALVGSAQVMTARDSAGAAIPILERALAAIRDASGAAHWRTAEAQLALGTTLMAMGAVARAEPLFREAVKVLESQASARRRLLVASRRALGEAEARSARTR